MFAMSACRFLCAIRRGEPSGCSGVKPNVVAPRTPGRPRYGAGGACGEASCVNPAGTWKAVSGMASAEKPDFWVVVS